MKIKNISIEGFKGIENKIVDFKYNKVAALLGPNGIGKTSFIEALQWGLTGNLPQNPIRDGFDHASVTITLEDDTEFSRTIFRDDKPTKVMVDGRATPAKNLNAFIKETFGFGTDVLEVATSEAVLASMKSDTLGDFLLQYVPEKLDVTKVLSFVSEPTEDIQKEIILTLPDEPFDIEELSKAHESFVETRKLAKKDLEFTKNKLSRLSAEMPTRELKVIQEELEDVLRKEGAAKTYRDALKLHEDSKVRRSSALKNLEILQSKFDAIKATRPNPILREDAEKKLFAEQSSERETRNMINIMTNTIKTLKVTLDRLSTNHCPLSDALICTTDKTKVRDEILETVRSNEAGIVIQEKKLKETMDSISSLSSFIKEYDSNALSYKEKILIGEQIEKAKKNVPEIIPSPSLSEEKDFEKEKTILKAEIKFAQEWEEKEKLEKKREEEEKRVATYEYLCKAFAPKGEVMTKILASYLSIFEEEINKRAEMLRTNMSVKFVSENGVKYLIKVKEEKEYHPYDELSRGEKTLAIFLLLDLVSALCGTRIMILDDLNNLDKLGLEELFAFVTKEEFLNAYDNVIISSVNYEDIMKIVNKYEVAIQTI